MTAGYLGLVPARGGSKGIPRKNLADLGGRPLVAYSIEAGLGSRRLAAVLVSSDDPEILGIARELGATPVERPPELAADDAPMLGAALHALDHAQAELGLAAETLVLLQPTSPFRDAGDVDEAIAAFERAGADTLASAVPVGQHPSDCVRVVGGRLERAVPPPHANASRQELEEFFYLDGAIYVAHAGFLREHGVFVDERTAIYVHERSRGLDIDDPFELEVARALVTGGRVS